MFDVRQNGAEGKFRIGENKAIADFTEAIRLNPPRVAEAYYNRGIIYKLKGDQAKAEAGSAKAKELGYEPE